MLLGVNVDHIATLRQARGNVVYPSPVFGALFAEKSGADSIVMHLREDRRHIQDDDVSLAFNELDIELNLEMSLNKGIVEYAVQLSPDKVTIVPEKRQELTTEGGFDLKKNKAKFKKAFDTLLNAGVEVSLFIDPDLEQIQLAYDMGVRIIELHTGTYADAETKAQQKNEISQLKKAAKFAKKLGIFVAAGHGLNLENVAAVAAIKEIEELNIGHSIISDAVFLGLKGAIREMKKAIKEARK